MGGKAKKEDHEMSEYEQQRLEHIKRNNEYLLSLGLGSEFEGPTTNASTASSASGAAATLPGAPPAKRARVKREKTKPSLPSRRSSRLKGAAPQYTGEVIDRFFDGEPTRKAVRVKAELVRSKKASSQSLEHLATTLDLSRQWLAASRRALLQLGGGLNREGSKKVTKTEAATRWRNEAVRRWGDAVPKVDIDWETYVASRLSTGALPPSEVDLMQEYYCHDSWRLLVCCTLMSRVSSWKTKSRCVRG